MKRIAVVISGLVLLSACGAAGESEDTAASTTTPSTPSSTADRDPETTMSDEVTVPDEVVESAIEKAASDTGLDANTLQPVSAERVVWSDASYDCPQEGQSYIQVLTDGYWVVLDGPQGELDYRSSLELDFRMCEDGSPPASIEEDE